MSIGVDFDFAKWIAVRRGSMEQSAREGAVYAFAGERKFRRTLGMARPVTMALEATTRLWRDVARTELLGTAVKRGAATPDAACCAIKDSRRRYGREMLFFLSLVKPIR